MELESSIKFLFSSDFNLFAQIEAGKNIRVSEVNSTKEHNYIIDFETGSTNVSEICRIPSSGKNVIAIADSQGAIKLFDFKSKTQEAELGGNIPVRLTVNLVEHVTRVLCLRVQEETGFLYSISADKKIVKWDLASFQPIESFDIDRKGTASEIKIDFGQNDLSLLVSLDNKIMLYNMQLQKAEKKFKGHPTNVHLLKGAAGSKYFASCSNEDAINIWNTEKEIPVLSLPILSQIYTNLDFCKVGKGAFLVLASSPSLMKLWFLRVTKSDIQVKSAITIRFQDRDLLQAKLYDKKSLIFAAYEESRPKFYIISLFQDAEGNNLKDEATLIQDINGAINQDIGITSESVKKKKKSTGKDKETAYHVVGESDENVLDQYRSLKKNGSDSARKQDDKADNFFLLDSIKSKEGNKGMHLESMDSLAVVLMQALQNNDAQLLDYCFENEDDDLIENTVRKLAHNKILVLLDRITERIDFAKKGNYSVFTWLNFIVKHHSAFLIKSSETAPKIAPLISLLQKRVLAVDQIHRLKGKIDMVLNVETEVRKQKKNQRKLHIEHKPLVVYEEGETKKPAKPTKNTGYTRAMEEMEEFEEEQGDKEFSDSISDSEGDINDEFDAYLHAGAEDYEEGEDDDKESDESYISV